MGALCHWLQLSKGKHGSKSKQEWFCSSRLSCIFYVHYYISHIFCLNFRFQVLGTDVMEEITSSNPFPRVPLFQSPFVILWTFIGHLLEQILSTISHFSGNTFVRSMMSWWFEIKILLLMGLLCLLPLSRKGYYYLNI